MSLKVVPRSTVRVMPLTVTLNCRGFKYRYTPTPMAARMITETIMETTLAFFLPFFL